MPDFPTPARLIDELNECRAYINPDDRHPRRGEVEAADYIMDLVDRWELGNAQRITMPRRSHKFERFFKEEPRLANIVIDVGDGCEEMLILHGHFDVVPPFDYASADSARLVQDATRSNIYRGLGSYDMLSGIAAILTSLHNMRVSSHRRVRAILVFGEENDSEGTHAAFDPSCNLFEFPGQKVALSTEISVGADMQTEPHLIVGRPGRFSLNATVYGKAMHAGDVKPSNRHMLTLVRGSKAKLGLLEFSPFSRHPHDTRELMDPCNITIGEYHTEKPRSLSTVGREDFELNVHYANPSVTIAAMHETIRKELMRILGDENFELTQPKRDMPWTQPWLEELDNEGYAYPHLIRDFANRTTAGRRSGGEVPFRTGTGVADENIISAHGIPVICVPPRGEGAHTAEEKVDIDCITDFQVPVIRAAAEYPLSLVRGDS